MTPQDVLDFWFLPRGDAGYGKARPEWFRKDAAFDAEISERFGALIAQAVAGGLRKTATVFAGDVQVEVIANYGQVRVTDAAGKPLAKAYVKVYGRKEGGEAVFYKDGYTDLRGRFDYSSLNTNDLDAVAKFAVLVMSDDHGAIVKEANPPKQ